MTDPQTGLLPGLLGMQVTSKFHGVVEDPTDNQHVAVATTDQEVPWTVDRSSVS